MTYDSHNPEMENLATQAQSLDFVSQLDYVFATPAPLMQNQIELILSGLLSLERTKREKQLVICVAICSGV